MLEFHRRTLNVSSPVLGGTMLCKFNYTDNCQRSTNLCEIVLIVLIGGEIIVYACY